MAIKFCCEVDFSATKTVKLIQKAYGDAELNQTTIMLAVYALCRKEANLLAAVAVIKWQCISVFHREAQVNVPLCKHVLQCLPRGTSIKQIYQPWFIYK